MQIYRCECGETTADHAMSGECLIYRENGQLCGCQKMRPVGDPIVKVRRVYQPPPSPSE